MQSSFAFRPKRQAPDPSKGGERVEGDQPAQEEDQPSTAVLQILGLALGSNARQADLPKHQGVLAEIEEPYAHRNEVVIPYSAGSGFSSDIIQHEITTSNANLTPFLPVGSKVVVKKYIASANLHSGRLDGTAKEATAFLRMLQQDLAVLLHPNLREHPNIAQLQFIGWESTSILPSLAIEFAAYGSLDDFLSAPMRGGVSQIGDYEKECLTQDILKGVAALHSECIMHGDLKPSNILVQSHPETGLVAKITDFSGCGIFVDGNIAPAAPEHHSTKAWMSPECLQGRGLFAWKKNDMYSLGLVVATMWLPQFIEDGEPVECFVTSAQGPDKNPHDLGCLSAKSREDNDVDSVLSLASGLLDACPMAMTVALSTLRLDPADRLDAHAILDIFNLTPNSGESPIKSNETKAVVMWNSLHGYMFTTLRAPFRERSPLFRLLVLDHVEQVLRKFKAKHMFSHEDCLDPLPSSDSETIAHLRRQDELLHPLSGHLDADSILSITLTFELALRYLTGTDVQQSFDNGFKWLELAALCGNDWAMSMYQPLCESVNREPSKLLPIRSWLILSVLKAFPESRSRLEMEDPLLYTRLMGFVKDIEGPKNRRESTEAYMRYLTMDYIIEFRQFGNPKGDVLLRYGLPTMSNALPWLRERMDSTYAQYLVVGSSAWTPGGDVFEDPIAQCAAQLEIDSLAEALEHAGLTKKGSTVANNYPSIDVDIATDGAETQSTKQLSVSNMLLLTLSVQGSYSSLHLKWRLGPVYWKRKAEVIALLLDYGADPLSYDPSTGNALGIAAVSGDTEAISLLLEHVRSSGGDIVRAVRGPATADQRSVLNTCISHGNLDTCKAVLQYSLGDLNDLYGDRFSPLEVASQQSDPEFAQILLDKGADPKRPSFGSGWLPFESALAAGNTSTALCLYAFQEKSRGEGQLSILGSIIQDYMLQTRLQDNMSALLMLRDKDADDFLVYPPVGLSALHVVTAAIPSTHRKFAEQHREVLSYLVNRFSSPEHLNALDSVGRGPLHLATMNVNEDAVRLLLKAGADPNLEMLADKRTALDIAHKMSRSVPKHISKGGAREIRARRKALQNITNVLLDSGAVSGKGATLFEAVMAAPGCASVSVVNSRQGPGINDGTASVLQVMPWSASRLMSELAKIEAAVGGFPSIYKPLNREDTPKHPTEEILNSPQYQRFKMDSAQEESPIPQSGDERVMPESSTEHVQLPNMDHSAETTTWYDQSLSLAISSAVERNDISSLQQMITIEQLKGISPDFDFISQRNKVLQTESDSTLAICLFSAALLLCVVHEDGERLRAILDHEEQSGVAASYIDDAIDYLADIFPHNRTVKLVIEDRDLPPSVSEDFIGRRMHSAINQDAALTVFNLIQASQGNSLAIPRAEHILEAVVCDSVRTLALFAARRVDMNISDMHGRTALHAAAAFGKHHLFTGLAKHGLQPGTEDVQGRHIMHHACRSGSVDTVLAAAELCRANNVDIEKADVDGWTPLQWAAASSHQDAVCIINLLLSMGLTDERQEIGTWSPQDDVAFKGSTFSEPRHFRSWSAAQLALFHGNPFSYTRLIKDARFVYYDKQDYPGPLRKWDHRTIEFFSDLGQMGHSNDSVAGASCAGCWQVITTPYHQCLSAEELRLCYKCYSTADRLYPDLEFLLRMDIAREPIGSRSMFKLIDVVGDSESLFLPRNVRWIDNELILSIPPDPNEDEDHKNPKNSVHGHLLRSVYRKEILPPNRSKPVGITFVTDGEQEFNGGSREWVGGINCPSIDPLLNGLHRLPQRVLESAIKKVFPKARSRADEVNRFFGEVEPLLNLTGGFSKNVLIEKRKNPYGVEAEGEDQ